MNRILKIIFTAFFAMASLGIIPVTAETEYTEDYKYLHREWGEWINTDLIAWDDVEPTADEVDVYQKETGETSVVNCYKYRNVVSEYWTSEQEGAEQSRESLRRPVPVSEEDRAKEGVTVWFYTDENNYFVRKELISKESKADEATFITGPAFRNTVKEFLPRGCSSFLKSEAAPASGVRTIDVSSEHDGRIVLFEDMNNIKWYSPAKTVFLNENSANMFEGVSAGTNFSGVIDLTGIDTSRVTNMREMFTRQGGMIIFGDIDTSNVTDMSGMFRQSYYDSLDLSRFNTSKVISMDSMFDEARNLTSLNISSFNTENVQNMHEMFSMTGLETLDLSGFNTANVRDMSGMFASCPELRSINVSSFNTANVQTMAQMFQNLQLIQTIDVSSFRLGYYVNLSGMFSGMTALKEVDLRSWNLFNTAIVEKADYMFERCSNLERIWVNGDYAPSVLSGRRVFEGCTNIIGISGTVYDSRNTGGDFAKIDSGTCSPGYLSGTPIPACPVGPDRDVEITIETYLDDEHYTGNEFEYVVLNEKTSEILGRTNVVEDGIAKVTITIPSLIPTVVRIYQVTGDDPWIQYDEAQYVKTITVPQIDPGDIH